MQYWADFESVHGFRCYDNTHVCKLIVLYTANVYSAEREMSASACTRSMAGSVCGALLRLSLNPAKPAYDPMHTSLGETNDECCVKVGSVPKTTVMLIP